MNREHFCQWFDTTQGQILAQNEAMFLNNAITLSYQQHILQLGRLGWEDQFVDCSCYRHFVVIDQQLRPSPDCLKISGKAVQLPIASESFDMIILPHLLEFEYHRYQVLREVERVLKPEGILIIIGFNPWSVFSLRQICKHTLSKKTEHAHFIGRSRMIDSLHLLNFEAEVVAGFDVDNIAPDYHQCLQNKTKLSIPAYAIRALKRQFNMMPLPTFEFKSRQFGLASANVSAKIITNE